MLPSTRREVSSQILGSNSARAMVLCILLLATAIITPQGNLYSGLLPPAAYAQQSEDEEKQQSQKQDGQTSDQALDESSQDLTVDIISNGTRGVAPATFKFEA